MNYRGRALALILLLSVVAGAQTTETQLHRLVEVANLIAHGDIARAEALLNSLPATVSEEPDALNLLGVIRAQQNRSAEAERLFKLALAASPQHIGAHINLSGLLLELSRTTEALTVLVSAHKLAPERSDINFNLATLFADTGNFQQALSHLKLIPRATATEDYFTLLLKTLIGLNRRDEVHTLLREFATLNSRPETAAEFALILAKSGFTDDASRLLLDAQQKTPHSFPVLYALGVIHAGLKRFDEAETFLTAALNTQPNDVTTLRALANVARATGKLEKSLAHLIEARKLAPKSPALLYDFAVTALKMDLLLDALPVFEQLRSSYPNNTAYLFGLAAARWRKGEPIEAARLMREYVALKPQDAAGFHLLGAALLRLNQFDEARDALKASITLRPNADVEYLVGVTYESQGNRKLAIETFKAVVSARPDHAHALAALGVQYRETGDYPAAMRVLERAVELDPNDLRANYQLGLVYSKLGERDKAKKSFARAEELRSEQRTQESVILKLIEPPEN
ncbi:MAG TPA: tetratricopeptide repeat protein [Pyrinomonadaceae bacterium]|nr:tetratricopeptide repeat protein [Pyrinomonadaceae bacterium]